jgi:hypothetical protein
MEHPYAVAIWTLGVYAVYGFAVLNIEYAKFHI